MSDLDYWTKALKKAERELDAATRLSDVNAAAKRLMLAKTELKRLEAQAAERPKRLAVIRAGRALPHNLLGFVNLEMS